MGVPLESRQAEFKKVKAEVDAAVAAPTEKKEASLVQKASVEEANKGL